jgi:hypothetical protein
MKKILHFLTLVLSFALVAHAQMAAVKRNVNLRPDPTTANAPLATLKPQTQLDLLEPDATNGYFHVTTTDNKEGWVWGKNIQIMSVSALPSANGRIGPPQLYPDQVMTPGLADTLNVEDLTKRYTDSCPSGKTSCTYSQAHRNVPEAVHTQVYVEYNVPTGERNLKHGEVDHFYPLCAGGSNDIKNLWDQPAENEWNGENFGFHEKDKLETYVCTQIIAGKMKPKDAFNRIKNDWVKFYLDLGLNSLD